jgi:hypothetical protein
MFSENLRIVLSWSSGIVAQDIRLVEGMRKVFAGYLGKAPR